MFSNVKYKNFQIQTTKTKNLVTRVASPVTGLPTQAIGLSTAITRSLDLMTQPLDGWKSHCVFL